MLRARSGLLQILPTLRHDAKRLSQAGGALQHLRALRTQMRAAQYRAYGSELNSGHIGDEQRPGRYVHELPAQFLHLTYSLGTRCQSAGCSRVHTGKLRLVLDSSGRHGGVRLLGVQRIGGSQGRTRSKTSLDANQLNSFTQAKAPPPVTTVAATSRKGAAWSAVRISAAALLVAIATVLRLLV